MRRLQTEHNPIYTNIGWVEEGLSGAPKLNPKRASPLHKYGVKASQNDALAKVYN